MAEYSRTSHQVPVAEPRTSGWLRGREVMLIKPPDFAMEGILPAKSLRISGPVVWR